MENIEVKSNLNQWPVQIKLVPVNAPYFDGANLLVAADCTAYSYGNFHNKFIVVILYLTFNCTNLYLCLYYSTMKLKFRLHMQQGCDFIKKYLETLKTVSLFTGLNDNDLIEMLNCLGANKQNYEKDSIVISVGDRISSVGIILSGSANIIKEDIDGNRNIISELKAGDLFAEVFACSGALRNYFKAVFIKINNSLISHFSKLS